MGLSPCWSRFFVSVLGTSLVLLLASCSTVPVKPAPTVLCRTFERGPLVVHADLDIDEHDPLFDELTNLQAEIAQVLRARPVATQVHLHLFASPAALTEFSRYAFPGVTPRRAWFVGDDNQQAVYAVWGPQAHVDLRHELTHAYLHAAWPSLPLWLDEGLAEYFESPPTLHGWQPAHIQALSNAHDPGPWRPDLARLESLTRLADLTAQDYAESWAWVHWLLHGSAVSRAILIEYLGRLRNDPEASLVQQVRERLPGANTALVAHLRGRAP